MSRPRGLADLRGTTDGAAPRDLRGARLAPYGAGMNRSASPLTRAGLALLSCAGASIAGCEVHPCNPAIVANGARYDVGIVDLFTAPPLSGEAVSYYASTGSCAGLDGIVPGSSLSFLTVGAVDNFNDTCRSVWAELLTGPAQLTPLPASSDPLAGQSGVGGTWFMEAFAEVTTADCSATETFAFLDNGLLYRLLLPSGGSCPICDDNFTIHLAGR